jgi:hypothetical protein
VVFGSVVIPAQKPEMSLVIRCRRSREGRLTARFRGCAQVSKCG